MFLTLAPKVARPSGHLTADICKGFATFCHTKLILKEVAKRQISANVMCNHFFPLKVECREILKKERKFNFFFFKRRGESGIFFAIATKMIYLILIDGKQREILYTTYNNLFNLRLLHGTQ
jgi:hypothetical protein